MLQEVQYGTTRLQYELQRSNRKTLAIEVHPDLSIHVIAPPDLDQDVVNERLVKRGSWIIKQQKYFEQFLPRTPKREYVSGESHLYLGKKYVLRIRLADTDSVKLKGGELVVFTDEVIDNEKVKRLLNGWYYNHARKKFEETISEAVKKFSSYGIEKPPLVVKRMSKRWGSCTPKGRIILNPEIIKAPKKCIEYVVIHELCHLIQPNHSSEFYKLQSEMMPDWEKWKMRLERVMV